MGEFDLIDSIKRRVSVPDGFAGIGDDCAILPQKAGFQTVVSTDMLVEGTHFILDRSEPFELGWKSLAVNLSDIAAMGARPVSSFLSLALPKGLTGDWIQRFMDGFCAISDQFACTLLGGDTTSSKIGLCINVAVTGEIETGRAKCRHHAQDGDLVCVTGPLGDSAAGLDCILHNRAGYEYLRTRHHSPSPRVHEGLELSAVEGVHAMMDISDGVASDLRHILRASGVGAEVETERIPTSGQLNVYCKEFGLDPIELALCGGEDYELLFTVSQEAEKSLGVLHYVIGRIDKSLPGLVWKGSDRDFMGYEHF